MPPKKQPQPVEPSPKYYRDHTGRLIALSPVGPEPAPGHHRRVSFVPVSDPSSVPAELISDLRTWSTPPNTTSSEIAFSTPVSSLRRKLNLSPETSDTVSATPSISTSSNMLTSTSGLPATSTDTDSPVATTGMSALFRSPMASITTVTNSTSSVPTLMSSGFGSNDECASSKEAFNGATAGISLAWDTEASQATGSIPEEDEEAKELKMLASAFAASGREGLSIKKIGPCDGSKPDTLLKWLRNLDIVEKPVDIARATATGPLGTFLSKLHIKDWVKLRSAIATQFISFAFPQSQRDALMKLTQRPGESLVTFNYEFEALVKEGYDKLPEKQEDLIRTYLSALNDRKLAIAVFNKKPCTLVEAMRLASERDRVNDFLRPRTGGRVSGIEETGSEIEEKLCKHMDSLTQTVNSLAKMQANLANQVASTVPVQANKPPAGVSRTPVKKDKRCYRCGRTGHFAQECRTPTQGPSSIQNRNVPRGCLRCRRTDHSTASCKMGPPKKPCLCGGPHWSYDCPRKGRATPGNWRAPQPQ